jgi:hypothetical protein
MAGSGGNFSGTDSYPVDMENSYSYTQTPSSQNSSEEFQFVQTSKSGGKYKLPAILEFQANSFELYTSNNGFCF